MRNGKTLGRALEAMESMAKYAADPNANKGEQRKYFFANGYGASVIRSPMSYGSNEGLWELAVLKGTEGNFSLCYDTPITDDVIGHLTEKAVAKLLKKVEALP